MSTTNFESESTSSTNGATGPLVETTALALTNGNSTIANLPVVEAHGGMSDWVHAFRRRWWLALSLGLIVGVAAGAAAWFTWKPEYTPVATLRIASQQPVLMYVTGDASRQSTFEIYKKTQRELIRDPFVLTAALRDPAVVGLPLVTQQQDPVAWLQNEIQILYPGDAEILDISMRGENANACTAVVNAVCDAYIELVVHQARNERMARLKSLETIHDNAEEKVRQKRSELRNLTDTLGTGDSHAATQKQQIALDSYASLRKERLDVQLQLMRAEAKQAVHKVRLEALEAEQVPHDLLEARIRLRPEYVAQVQALEKMQADLQDVESMLVPGQQRVVSKRRDEIVAGEQKLAKLQTSLQPLMEDQLRQELLQQARLDTQTTKIDVSTLHAEDERLGIEVEKLGGEANQIGRSSVDLEMMRAELDNLDTIRKQVATEVENLKIELASGARVELLSRAEVPKAIDDKPHIRRAVSFAGVGFLLLVFWVCWRDARRKRVNTAHDVSAGLGLLILGTMPLVPTRAHRRITERAEPTVWNHVMIEAVDSIRETLLSEARNSTLKVVVVTSALEGEGKTTVATQLAKSFGRAQHRTLLMDCDLRCPATHLAFPESTGPGLFEVLSQNQELNVAIYPTAEPNLYHLPAGDVHAGSHEILARTRRSLAGVFQQLRAQFDFVIVDSGPILPVVDTLVVGQSADAAVLSIMRDVSRSDEILEAQSRLARVGVKVLGAIVTCKGSRAHGSGYRYGYALNGAVTN